MSSDEDSELILEGGELYNYFKSHGVDNFDVYSSKQPTFVVKTDKGPPSFVYPKLVPKEVLDIVSEILNSKLLLEEDAIYIFQKSSEVVPQYQTIVASKVLLPGIIIAVSTYGSWKLCNLRKFWISVIACSTFVLFCGIKDKLRHLQHSKTINKLLNNLQVTVSYIRKHIKLIQEEDSLINSKQKVLHLRNNGSVINDYSIKRKRAEIFIISKKVIVILKSLILLSRTMTLAILKIDKQKSSISNITYIALCSDEQLGISKDSIELNEETNTLPLIDSLKNIYVMMQSETLRELCLCLCGIPEVLEISVFNILQLYTSQSSSILLELKNLYETHFYPTYVSKKVNRVNNKLTHLSNVLNSVSCTLNGLLIDSRKLQEYMDENSDESSIQTVGLKLLDMERDIASLLEHINTSCQHLLKKTNYNQKTVPIVPESNEKIIKTGFTVGMSDFSVNGQDEVFLGYVEGPENGVNNSENFEEYIKPTYFNILMKELKDALISKREDFEKREIKALKSNKDFESYKACSVNSSMSAVSDNQLNFKSSVIEQNSLMSNLEGEEVGNTYSPLSKDVAREAISVFTKWNTEINEDCFGDESDNEDT